MYLNESCPLTCPSSKCSERGIFSNMLQHLQPLKYQHYAEMLVSPQLAPISPIKLTAVSKDVSSNHSNTSGTALSRRSRGPRFKSRIDPLSGNPQNTRARETRSIARRGPGNARWALFSFFMPAGHYICLRGYGVPRYGAVCGAQHVMCNEHVCYAWCHGRSAVCSV